MASNLNTALPQAPSPDMHNDWKSWATSMQAYLLEMQAKQQNAALYDNLGRVIKAPDGSTYVQTDHIVVDAVTNLVTDYQNSGSTLHSGSWVTVNSVTVTGSNHPVWLHAASNVTVSTPCTVTFRLLKSLDGGSTTTEVWPTPAGPKTGFGLATSNDLCFSADIKDTDDDTGYSVIYHLDAKVSIDAAGVRGNSFLSALTLKR